VKERLAAIDKRSLGYLLAFASAATGAVRYNLAVYAEQPPRNFGHVWFLFGMLIIGVIAAGTHVGVTDGWAAIRQLKGRRNALLYGVLMGWSTLATFLALDYLNEAVMSSLQQTSILVTLALAVWLLGERFTKAQDPCVPAVEGRRADAWRHDHPQWRGLGRGCERRRKSLARGNPAAHPDALAQRHRAAHRRRLAPVQGKRSADARVRDRGRVYRRRDPRPLPARLDVPDGPATHRRGQSRADEPRPTRDRLASCSSSASSCSRSPATGNRRAPTSPDRSCAFPR